MNLGAGGRMVAAAAMAAIMILAPGAAAADSGDVEAVYCLNDARRPEVVQAAVHLGKGARVADRPSMLAIGGVPGRVVSLESWRRTDREDFNEVCSALIKANSVNPAGGGGSGLWNSVLLVVLGAVLPVLGTIVVRIHERRGERLDALAVATDDFRNSAEAYLEAWQYDAGAAHDMLATDRKKLAAKLRGLRAGDGRRKEARRLAAGLPLARQLSGVITDESGRQRPKDYARRRNEIDELHVGLSAALARADLLADVTGCWFWHRAKHRVVGWLGRVHHLSARIRRGRRRRDLPGGDGR